MKKKSFLIMSVSLVFVVLLLLLFLSGFLSGLLKIKRTLPGEEIEKITGTARLTEDSFMASIYNGSNFIITEMTVNIAVYGKDGNIRWRRDYVLFSKKIPPLTAGKFYSQIVDGRRTEINKENGEYWREEYEWKIVEAKGYKK